MQNRTSSSSSLAARSALEATVSSSEGSESLEASNGLLPCAI